LSHYVTEGVGMVLLLLLWLLIAYITSPGDSVNIFLSTG